MTREEILNMPADRDLDALIAENVFGYKLEGENKNVVIFPDGDFSYLVPDLGGHWSPSFDIREAIKVSEKLRDFVGVAPYRNFLRLEDLGDGTYAASFDVIFKRSEEHTSELQSLRHL